MLKKVKSKSNPYIIVCMQAPIQKKVMEPSWDVVDEPDSDLEDNQATKKVHIPHHLSRFDTQFLEGKTGWPNWEDCHKTFQQVPSRTMWTSLRSPLFSSSPVELHFNLDHSQLLVWAQAIKSGTSGVTYEKVPILSPMFKVLLALKHASKDATNTDTAPTSA